MRAGLNLLLLVPFFTCIAPVCALAQQDYVGRYDFFSGFSYFESPAINLAERGYHLQAGVNVKSWYAVGFDYSNVNGTLNLLPSYLPAAIQAELALAVTAGTQLSSRRPHPHLHPNIRSRTHARPSSFPSFRHSFASVAGAVRELATPHPNDPLTTLRPAPDPWPEQARLARFLWRRRCD